MQGDQLVEFETVIEECFRWHRENNTEASCASSEDKYALNIQTVLSSWAFNLDLLKMDDSSTPASGRFKTPIGWMTDILTCTHECWLPCAHHYLQIDDPHGLLPLPRLENEPAPRNSTTMSFSYIREKSDALLQDQPRFCDAYASGSSGDMSENSKNLPDHMVISTPGWKHIGRLDTATGTIHAIHGDNGAVAEAEVKDGSRIEPLTINSNADEHLVGSGEYRRKDLFVNTFSHITDRRNDSHGEGSGKELAMVILRYLKTNDAAIRDVLLAHAMVNGNVKLSYKLLYGTWTRTLVSKDDTANSSPNEILVEPVSPTLAHLLILQKLGREPLNCFVELILIGSPFLQGHVKSSQYKLNREQVYERRVERHSVWHGQKNDEPMLSQLVGMIDAESEEMDEMKAKICSRDSLLDKEDSAFEDEKTLDLMTELAESEELCIEVNLEGYLHEVTVNDVRNISKSLALWLKHLLLLQSSEKRKELIRKTALNLVNQGSSTAPSSDRSSFSLGLDDMIRRVQSFRKELRQKWDLKVQAVREANIEQLQAEKVAKTKMEMDKIRKKEMNGDTSHNKSVNTTSPTASQCPVSKKRKQGINDENSVEAERSCLNEPGSVEEIGEGQRLRRKTRSMTKQSS